MSPHGINYISSDEYLLTANDEEILNSYKGLLKPITMVFGPNCLAVLRSAEEGLPCIAVENPKINDVMIGDPAPGFIVDAVHDEVRNGDKDYVGIYYTKTKEEHTIKCILYIIRNHAKNVIGCLCIGIDVSVPLSDFVENFIPRAGEDLADSLSEPVSSVADIDTLIDKTIESAKQSANAVKGLSATDRNRLIVQQLKNDNIFNMRGAVNLVAKELGVSRYTIYNYLKDTAIDA